MSFGGRSTLTFAIDNTANSSLAANLSFSDSLPVGMTVASPANASTTCSGGTITAASGSSLIAYGPSGPGSATVAAGASCTVRVDVIGGAVGVLGNTSGELTSFSGTSLKSSGKASATLTVTVEQISLTKSFTDDPVLPGDAVTLEFTVRNLDRRSSAANIAFTDDLDATLSGLVAVGLPLADPCGSGSALSGTSVLALSGGSLAAEGSCTFSVTLQVPGAAVPGEYTNTTSSITAEVGGQPVTGNPASDVLFLSAAPVLTKTFLGDPVGAGDTVTLEFTITNTSTSAIAGDIAITDNLTAVVSGVVVTSLPAPGFCGAGSFLSAAQILGELNLVMGDGSLAASGSCTFSVDLALPVGTPGGTFTNTTSEITATVDGEAVTGSAASDDLTIASGPLPAKQFTDDPVAPGDTVTLEFTLSQSEEAGGAATAIAFSDDLTAVLAGLTATGLPASDVCGSGSQIDGTTHLTFTGGTLAAGESCTFSVTLQVPSTAVPGPHAHTTSNVMSTVGGVAVTSAAAEDTLQVTGLTFTKTFTDDPVVQGDSVTLEFSLANTTPDQSITDIVFTDSLSAVVSGLASTSGTLTDPCGVGSQLSGTSSLLFTGGNLAAGESCTFSVTLAVPSGAASGDYANTTSALTAEVGGTPVVFDPASDGLTIANDLLVLSKDFTDDPVGAGETVTLEFTLINLADKAVSGVAFTDDLDGALAGLVSTSGTIADPCGAGSQLSGSELLTFTGGSLATGASCTFAVTLAVPAGVQLGVVATNTTSQVTGLLAGLFAVTGDAAVDDLQIDSLSFSKSFGGAVAAGDTVPLLFTIENASQTASVDRISFTDDLDGVLSGLVALALPETDVCGPGSELAGTDFLTLTGASLLAGGSCSFSVTLQVPASAAPGLYANETSELLQNGLRAAATATDILTILEEVDEDGDGVLDDDVCPGTAIPEGVPTVALGTNRYALVDGDGIFDTNPSNGGGPGEVFTIEDTAGCSCEQIIVAQDLGKGHVKFGCSVGAMNDWVDLVNP